MKLFPTAADHVSEARKHIIDSSQEARWAGIAARKEQRAKADNPFHFAAELGLALAWTDGWDLQDRVYARDRAEKEARPAMYWERG